jgi:hypothetical protein
MRRAADRGRRGGGKQMGTVVNFPGVRRGGRGGKSIVKNAQSAIVIILPTIRIERYQPYEPEPIRAQPRRRRPRASRT